MGPGDQDRLLLGKYEVLERIGSGGMAEVFRARTLGPGGFAKMVCIKRILPQFARDASFIQMLVSEASVTSQLQHGNIAHVFDLEEEQGEYYIIMELVDGCDLLQALTQRARSQRRLDEDVVLQVMSMVARGLHFAHEALDVHGSPLHIVHRDISPSNILLSRHGEVKLVDFGVAKVGQDASQDIQRRAGALKGKLGYMSPEMVTNRAPSRGSDIFALGIVLWESLTLRRLFLGASEVQTLLNVRDVRIDTKLRRHDYVSEEVLKVIRRTLEKDTKDRFSTAAEFADALEDILFDRRVRTGVDAIAHLVLETLGGPEQVKPPVRPPSVARDQRPQTRRTLRLDTQPDLPPLPFTPARVASSEEPAKPRSPWDVFSQGSAREEVNDPFRLTQASFHLRGLGLAQFGPITYVALLRMIHARSVTLSEEVSVDGGDWMPLGELGLPRVSEEEAPPCIQEGPLNRIRLPQLVYECAVARITGILKLSQGGISKEIAWRNGLITDVRSNIKGELLARFLVDAQGVERVAVDEALEHAEEHGIRLGDALVELKVLSAPQLARALETQCRARFNETFRWRGGWYELSTGDWRGHSSVGLVEDPFALLAAAIAQETTAEFLAETFENFRERTLLIKGNPRVDFTRFQFADVDVDLLQDLREGEPLRQTLQRLATNEGSLLRLYRLLFLLHQTDFVSFDAPARVDPEP